MAKKQAELTKTIKELELLNKVKDALIANLIRSITLNKVILPKPVLKAINTLYPIPKYKEAPTNEKIIDAEFKNEG